MECDSTLLDEDDSLLQPTRIDHRISPIRKYILLDSVKDNCSSSQDASNKENISSNKIEGQKLNVEPVQMKKKRKGGGYNLRKSLAWDRSFFTEEGVLDPLELSIISGTHINSPREGLSTINEEDSHSGDYQSGINSADLQALEKNLFKEVPAASLEKHMGTLHLPPKHNSPASAHKASTSAASPKVRPTHGASRAGSRAGGCSRAVPLTSLKRPANINACQAVTKESKLPRFPACKPGYSSTLVTRKNSVEFASHVKQKQITRPVVITSNKRNVVPNSSPKRVKHNQNKTKAVPGSLPVKASASRLKRNVVSTPIHPHSYTQLNPPAGNKVINTCPKAILDNVGPSVALPLSDCQDGSTRLPSSLPEDTSTASSTKQHKQFPTVKPSGLRLPSPSLGFFSQPKSSVSHCASKKGIEDDVPCLRKPGHFRPPHSQVRVIDVVNDIKPIIDTSVLKPGSDFQAVSHERMKQSVGEDDTRKFLKFSNEDESSDPTNDKNETCSKGVSSILGSGESRISIGSDRETVFLHHQISVKCAKGVSGTGNSIESSLSCLQDLHHVSEKHVDMVKPSSGETIAVTCGDEQFFREKSSYNNDTQNHSTENLVNADFNDPAYREIELKISGPSSQERPAESEKSLLEDDVTLQSNNEETELLVSASRCKNSHDCCSEVGDLHDFSGKSLELQSPNLVQDPQNKYELSADDCVSLEKDSEEYTQKVTESPGTMSDVTYENVLDSSEVISQVPVGIQNEHFHMRKMVAEAHAEDSVQPLVKITSSVENQHCSVTRKVGSDVTCSNKITPSASHSALKPLIMDKYRTFSGNNLQNRQVNEDDLMEGEPENLLNAHLDSEITDVNSGSFLAENKFHGKDQKCNLQNIPEAESMIYDSSMIALEKSNISQVSNARQIGEYQKEETCSGNLLQVENEPARELDCNVPVEKCCSSNMQVVSNQYTVVGPAEKSGGGLPNFCIMVEDVPDINQSLLLENCSRTVLAEHKENNVFKTRVHACLKTIDDNVGELESPTAVCNALTPVQANGDDGDKYNNDSYAVHIVPSYVEHSSEIHRPFTGSPMKHDMEHGEFLDEDLRSSGTTSQRVNRLKESILLNEIKVKVPQDVDSLAEESHSGLDVASCLENDKHTTEAMKKSQNSSSSKSSRTIPPINAVPFSDEWLAAMEAAGEDILKMKSGAVQNSPTDKSLPEPSPWSPVRKKNNPIGPFDCTKFTNNLPSDSQ